MHYNHLCIVLILSYIEIDLLFVFPFIFLEYQWIENSFITAKLITFFLLRNTFILNRFSRTILNTGHTVRARFPFPDRTPILHLNCIYRTQLFTFSTWNTVISDMKAIYRLFQIAPNGIKGNCNERFKKPNVPRVEIFSILYLLNLVIKKLVQDHLDKLPIEMQWKCMELINQI